MTSNISEQFFLLLVFVLCISYIEAFFSSVFKYYLTRKKITENQGKDAKKNISDSKKPEMDYKPCGIIRLTIFGFALAGATITSHHFYEKFIKEKDLRIQFLQNEVKNNLDTIQGIQEKDYAENLMSNNLLRGLSTNITKTSTQVEDLAKQIKISFASVNKRIDNMNAKLESSQGDLEMIKKTVAGIETEIAYMKQKGFAEALVGILLNDINNKISTGKDENKHTKACNYIVKGLLYSRIGDNKNARDSYEQAKMVNRRVKTKGTRGNIQTRIEIDDKELEEYINELNSRI